MAGSGLPQLRPLDRDSTSSRIAARIRSAIIKGALPPGTQLAEVSLTQRLGVSRGPVREALQRLIQEGLVVSGRNRGAFVAELGLRQIQDLYLTRALIESAVAEKLAQQNDVRSLEPLEESLARIRRAKSSGIRERVTEADLRFHTVLVASVGSDRLSRAFATLSAETRICLRQLATVYPEGRDAVGEHRAILDAIKSGDSLRASFLVREHMEDSVQQLSQALYPAN
ncbi:MAG: GntR family transcriptional regulator [Candidatus Dormibacteria bacterium]